MTFLEYIMETLLILRVKNVYGKALVYPVCQQSGLLAALANKKTFSPRDLKMISLMGFRIGFNNIPTECTEPFNQNQYKGFQKFLDGWNI